MGRGLGKNFRLYTVTPLLVFIRDRATELGFDQWQFATATKMSDDFILGLMKGEYKDLKTSTIIKLAEALDTKFSVMAELTRSHFQWLTNQSYASTSTELSTAMRKDGREARSTAL